MKLIKRPVVIADGKILSAKEGATYDLSAAKKGTMAYTVLAAHNVSGNDENLQIKFDALTSHDITYVGIVQTAKASGLEKFPVPYSLTNCHNSLCAVGGTINEDDHVFGLSAAKKYGGNFVPAHVAVIHQYMRETEAKGGAMILGSDSHTRYGALGTMAVGEGGPELVKQILGRTYDVKMPEVIAVVLRGKPRKGVGPQDVALALIGATFKSGFVKNKVLEFVGSGIKNLSMDYRNGIDVMTTETTCLSSIWQTDERTKEYYEVHGRSGDYKRLAPAPVAAYAGAVVIDLAKIEPMIALPFHPSNVYTIREFLSRPREILESVEKAGEKLLGGKGKFTLTDKITADGKVRVSQGVIAGCAGGMYENVAEAAELLKQGNIGTDEFALSVYPSSLPVFKSLTDNGYISSLMGNGAVVKTAFCGPCFGAGDVPANNGLSIRHTTRNFESREGSKPGDGQLAAVCLMDARSIAATAANGGILTPATDMDYKKVSRLKKYAFDGEIYQKRVYHGAGNANAVENLKYGPNIADWPKMYALSEDLAIEIASVIHDPVTTTDELIPSGETSSYRSNPEKLSSFALSRKDPGYVGRAKVLRAEETERRESGNIPARVRTAFEGTGIDLTRASLGTAVASIKPGDGSAREQAASCQRVLGGVANIATEYATKRYRSNLINWGMLPFLYEKNEFELGDWLFIEGVREAVKQGKDQMQAKLVRGGKIVKTLTLSLGALTDDEREIILKGCLINYYSEK